MAIPTLLLPMEGNLEGQERNGPTVATATGAVRWVDGPRTERKEVSPLLVASPDHSEDRKGPLAPFLSSSVTLGQGRYGKTWKLKKANTPQPTLKLSPIESRDQTGDRSEVYEETENLYPNPSFESNANPYIDGFTRTMDSSEAFHGEQSLRLGYTTTGGTQPYVYLPSITGSVSEGDVVTASLYVKSNQEFGRWRFECTYRNEANGVISTLYTKTDLRSTTEWSRLDITLPAAPVNTSHVAVSLRTNRDWLPSDFVAWVDAVQIEKKPYPTPYVDGDMVEGTWTGTPHASTSKRVRGSALKGVVRPATVGGKAAWYFEEETTNLVLNPSAETGTTGVGGANLGMSFSRGTEAYVGTSSYRIDLDGSQPNGGTYINTITELGGTGETYTAQAMVKAPVNRTISTNLRAYYTDGTNGEIGTRDTHATTGDWQRIVVTRTTDTDKELNYLRLLVSLNTGGNPTTYHIDAVQIEKKDYATTYADGSLGAGYAWSGTPHASVSTRTKGTVEIPFQNQVTNLQGSVYAWISIPAIAKGSYPIAINGTSGFLLGMHSQGYINSYLGSGVQNLGDKVSNKIPRDTPVLVGLEWDEQTAYITYNGQIVNQMSRSNTNVSFGNTILIGYYGTSNPRPSYVHEVLMFPRKLTDTERTFVANQSWNWNELNEIDGEVVVGDGETRFVRNTLARYVEDGEHKTTRIEGRAGAIGKYGRFSTWDGSLRLLPNEGSTFEVEDVVLYEQDVEQIEDKVGRIEGTWSMANTGSVLDVPIKIPFFEENTRNLVNNPHTQGLQHIGITAGTATIQEGNTPVSSRYFAAFTGDGAGSFQYINFGCSAVESKPIGARTFTASAWVRAEEGVPFALVVWLRGQRGGVFTNGQKTEWFTGTGDWQRVSVTATSAEDNDLSSTPAVSVATSFVNGAPRVSATVHVTGVQLEEKAYATTFCPQLDVNGNPVTGYSWTGLMHGSASVRAAGFIPQEVPPFPQGRGSFYIQHTPTVNHAKSRNPHIFYQNGASNILYRRASDSAYTVKLGAGTNADVRIPEDLQGKTKRIGVEWENGIVRLIIDGVGVANGTCPVDYAPTGTWYFGSSNDYNLDGTVEGFVMFDRPLTDHERSILFAVETWEWDTVFPTLGEVVRHPTPSGIGVIRRTPEE